MNNPDVYLFPDGEPSMDIATIVYILTEIKEILPTTAPFHKKALQQAINYLKLINTYQSRH